MYFDMHDFPWFFFASSMGSLTHATCRMGIANRCTLSPNPHIRARSGCCATCSLISSVSDCSAPGVCDQVYRAGLRSERIRVISVSTQRTARLEDGVMLWLRHDARCDTRLLLMVVMMMINKGRTTDSDRRWVTMGISFEGVQSDRQGSAHEHERRFQFQGLHLGHSTYSKAPIVFMRGCFFQEAGLVFFFVSSMFALKWSIMNDEEELQTNQTDKCVQVSSRKAQTALLHTYLIGEGVSYGGCSSRISC